MAFLTLRACAGGEWEEGCPGSPLLRCLLCRRKNQDYTPCCDTGPRRSSHRRYNPGRSSRRRRRSEAPWAGRLALLKWAPEKTPAVRGALQRSLLEPEEEINLNPMTRPNATSLHYSFGSNPGIWWLRPRREAWTFQAKCCTDRNLWYSKEWKNRYEWHILFSSAY